MGNRTLVEYTEPAYPGTTPYKLRIERGAAGAPNLFVSITTALGDELSVFVEDGKEVLQPVIEWLGLSAPVTEDTVGHAQRAENAASNAVKARNNGDWNEANFFAQMSQSAALQELAQQARVANQIAFLATRSPSTDNQGRLREQISRELGLQQ